MQRPVDVEAGEVTDDRLRNRIGRHQHLDGMAHDVQGAAALDAGRLVEVDEVNRDLEAELRAGTEPQEIDMDRRVLDAVELVIARDHPLLAASDVDLEDRGQEVARVDVLVGLAVVE